MTDTKLAHRVETAADLAPPTTPMDLMQQAIETGNLDALERLQAMQERWEDRQAEKALHEALAAFQASVPHIKKERTAGERAGAGYGYSYAALDDIERAIRPVLAEHGLSYTHDIAIDGADMTVTCTIFHVDGAKRSSQWVGPASGDGKMNAIQKVGSATTYGRRYSLINALGLTTTDHDDDGAGSFQQPTGPIDEDQLRTLTARCAEVDADVRAFCGVLGVQALAELPADQFGRAMVLLQKKAAQKAAKGDA